MKPNKTLTYIIIAGLIGVLFIPFIISNSMLFPFITGKGFTFRILVEILTGLWVAGMFFDASIRPKVSWLTWSALAFLGVVFLADIFGHNFYHSFWSNYERMDGFLTTLHVVAYFFVVSSVLNTRMRWRAFFETSVVASVIMAFYTFLQLGGKIVINQGGVRIDGTFGNATYLAVYMLLNIFITLFLVLGEYERTDKRNRWFLYSWYCAALVCQLISLYYTQTRGAILGLFGGLLLTFIFITIFEKIRPVLRKISIGVIVALLVLMGTFVVFRNSHFVQSSSTLSRFASFSLEQTNNLGRRFVWPMAWQGFKDKPILGWGQENFNYVFNKYYAPEIYNLEPWYDRAHNVVLDWLVAGGVVGLLTYFSLFAAALYLLWKNDTYSVGQKGLLFGMLAGYFFQNFFVFDNLISYVYFFSILAFIHTEYVRNKQSPVWIEKIAQNKALSRMTIPAIATVVVVILIYGLNIRQIGASQNIIQGLTVANNPTDSLDYFRKVFDADTFASGEATDQLSGQFQNFSNPNVTTDVRQAYAKLLIDNLDKEINRFPDDARYLLSMGSIRVRMSDPNGALPYLERAHQQSPRKQTIYYETGFAYLTAGDTAKALDQFKAAYDLNHDNPEAKVLYAVGALYAKQDKFANGLITELVKLPDFFDERLVSALVSTGHAADAVKMIESHALANPSDVNLQLRLAAGYLSTGQRARALTLLKEIEKKFPQTTADVDYYIKEIEAGRDPSKQK